MLEENQDFTPYAPQFGISRKTKPKNYPNICRLMDISTLNWKEKFGFLHFAW